MNRHALTIAPEWSRADRHLMVCLTIVGCLGLTASCSSAPNPETSSRPEEDWIATTCSPASPDTTGWKVHRLSDVELLVPADFAVRNRTSRSIEFVQAGAVLTLLVSTSPTPEIFYAAGRPALAKEEAGCTMSMGGYPGLVVATTRPGRTSLTAARFRLDAEWEGAPLWGAGDWRKRLFARITTGTVRDAQRLRDALHTLKVSEKR